MWSTNMRNHISVFYVLWLFMHTPLPTAMTTVLHVVHRTFPCVLISFTYMGKDIIMPLLRIMYSIMQCISGGQFLIIILWFAAFKHWVFVLKLACVNRTTYVCEAIFCLFSIGNPVCRWRRAYRCYGHHQILPVILFASYKSVRTFCVPVI